jgi:hypothetical protein
LEEFAMVRFCICTVAGLVILLESNIVARAQARFPLNIQAGQKKEGGTSVDAFAKISKQPQKGLIEARLWVRKSGISGKGTGAAVFILLDKDGNTVYKSPVLSRQIGAKFPEGTREENTTADWDVGLNELNATRSVVIVTSLKDTGFLDELKAGLENFIKDHINEITDVAKEMIHDAKNELKKELIKNGVKYAVKSQVAN